jgi:hypothetical protein
MNPEDYEKLPELLSGVSDQQKIKLFEGDENYFGGIA